MANKKLEALLNVLKNVQPEQKTQNLIQLANPPVSAVQVNDNQVVYGAEIKRESPAQILNNMLKNINKARQQNLPLYQALARARQINAEREMQRKYQYERELRNTPTAYQRWQMEQQVSDDGIRQKAIQLAQKDPRWKGSGNSGLGFSINPDGTVTQAPVTPVTTEDRQKLIEEYINLLTGQTPNNTQKGQTTNNAPIDTNALETFKKLEILHKKAMLSHGPEADLTQPSAYSTKGTSNLDPQVQTMIEQARVNGYTDEEIAQALRDQGLNPADYGF